MTTDDKAAKTKQLEEQRWLTERWLNDHHRPTRDAECTDRTSDQNEIDHASRQSDGENDSICHPTLEKLYAAQRKQKADLKRQIDDAMAQDLE